MPFTSHIKVLNILTSSYNVCAHNDLFFLLNVLAHLDLFGSLLLIYYKRKKIYFWIWVTHKLLLRVLVSDRKHTQVVNQDVYSQGIGLLSVTYCTTVFTGNLVAINQHKLCVPAGLLLVLRAVLKVSSKRQTTYLSRAIKCYECYLCLQVCDSCRRLALNQMNSLQWQYASEADGSMMLRACILETRITYSRLLE